MSGSRIAEGGTSRSRQCAIAPRRSEEGRLRGARKEWLMRVSRVLFAAVMIAAMAGSLAPSAGASAKPLWVTHVQRYSGGISSGVRFSLDPAVVAAQAKYQVSQ